MAVLAARFTDLLSQYNNLRKEVDELRKAKELLHEEVGYNSTAYDLVKTEYVKKARELSSFENKRYAEVSDNG